MSREQKTCQWVNAQGQDKDSFVYVHPVTLPTMDKFHQYTYAEISVLLQNVLRLEMMFIVQKQRSTVFMAV